MLNWFVFWVGAASVYSCTNDVECSLNGVCDAGSCTCDIGWGGLECGNLSLGKTDPTLGHPWNSDASSWGGLPILADDGSWHLFYSQFSRGCGLNDWSTNSRIVHAVAATSVGPFIDIDVVEPAFSHNAQAMRAIDGTWVVWYIGCGQGEAVRDCGGSPADKLPLANRTVPIGGPGTNPSPWCAPFHIGALGEGYVTYSSAPTPSGPWTPLGVPAYAGSNTTTRWDYLVTNPAPWQLPNGSVVLGLSGDGGVSGKCLSVASAATWNGTYVAEGGATAAICGGEDPFLWVDARGNRHMTWHDVSGRSNGGHAFSPPDSPQAWTVGTRALYTGNLTWANGTHFVVNDRERPKLVFGADGAPVALFNGVAVYPDMRSFTAVTAVV
jgi:hypothetical protein